ncbi:MAG: zinc metalloprotease [Bacteroidetes bacterium]|nr:zinc metalloprotease [Bacteroidota bacterium]
MKKLFVGIAVLAMVFTACEKEGNEESIVTTDLVQELDKAYHEQCGTMGRQAESIQNNPSLQDSYDAIERFTQKAIAEAPKGSLTINVEIPVVYHVIYRTNSENLPLSVLEGQIDALNEDFNLNNPGRAGIPSEFQGVEANVGISFVLQDVIRVQNSKKRRWRPNDDMKFSNKGGSDVVNPQEFLNIWIVNYMPYQGGQILGYAQFPGGNWATDGIVLGANFVGSTDRTATHEVGHWANLRHIWGDGGCSVDDFVADTPVSDRSNGGCPSYPTVHCGSNDMTMNFMDYTNDVCMHMFTEGQKARMSTVFAPGGFREAMGN